MHAYQENADWRLQCTHRKTMLTGDFTGGLMHYTVEHNGKISPIKGKYKEQYIYSCTVCLTSMIEGLGG